VFDLDKTYTHVLFIRLHWHRCDRWKTWETNIFSRNNWYWSLHFRSVGKVNAIFCLHLLFQFKLYLSFFLFCLLCLLFKECLPMVGWVYVIVVMHFVAVFIFLKTLITCLMLKKINLIDQFVITYWVTLFFALYVIKTIYLRVSFLQAISPLSAVYFMSVVHVMYLYPRVIYFDCSFNDG